MWQRFTLYDVRVIAHYLGVLTTVFTAAFLVPLVTAILFQEWEAAARYLLAVGLSMVIGTALRLCRVQPGELNYLQAMAVTGLAWLFLAFIAAVPLSLSGHYGSYLDALFEGVSGLTTTGMSLAIDLEHMAYADNMWRFTMHFIGGLGLVVVALSLGLLGRGTSGLYSSEGRSEHVLPNIVVTTRIISRISIAIILVATIVLSLLAMIAGMEPVRAFLHALWVAVSGFMTAGFTPTSQSIMYYHSYPFELVCMLLMLLGLINFALFVEVWRGRSVSFFKDVEIKTGFIWLVVACVVFMLSLSSSGMFSDLPAMLRRGIFMIVAAESTAGFQVVTTNQMTTVFSSGAFLVLAIMMAIGGSSGSTAGGIKLSRIGFIAKSVSSTVRETLSPGTARISTAYYHLGRRILSTDIARAAMTVSSLFVIAFLVGALVGIAHGYDAVQAIFESISVASNGGLSSGIATRGMPPALEAVYIVEMWAGRLEFVTLIALIVKIVVSVLPKKKGFGGE